MVWAMLLVYVLARICQVYADRLPTLFIVVLHVVSPALFALAHGSALYRARGIVVFAAFCLGFGTLAESVSLRTGFPFGHYYFTDVMGPKIFQLPVLLALAYLGIGYVAWILAVLILGYFEKPVRGTGVIALPLLASLIMLAWDLSMDPNWSTLNHVWIWQNGGAYFGVPISNFFGWFLVAYLYYQAFALYCRAHPTPAAPPRQRFWLPPILFYAVCALGNLLVLRLPMAPTVVNDATGKQWLTADILGNSVLVSLLVMMPFSLMAWLKVRSGPAVKVVQAASRDCARSPGVKGIHPS
jgi:putative membrane protein